MNISNRRAENCALLRTWERQEPHGHGPENESLEKMRETESWRVLTLRIQFHLMDFSARYKRGRWGITRGRAYEGVAAT